MEIWIYINIARYIKQRSQLWLRIMIGFGYMLPTIWGYRSVGGFTFCNIYVCTGYNLPILGEYMSVENILNIYIEIPRLKQRNSRSRLEAWDWKKEFQSGSLIIISEQVRKPRSYASSKLWPTDSLTRVKSRATSVAKKVFGRAEKLL